MPVIMVTAESDKGQVLTALQAGASDYLIKPFDSMVLRKKVKKFCNPTALEAYTAHAGRG